MFAFWDKLLVRSQNLDRGFIKSKKKYGTSIDEFISSKMRFKICKYGPYSIAVVTKAGNFLDLFSQVLQQSEVRE